MADVPSRSRVRPDILDALGCRNCEFIIPDYTLSTTSSDNCYPDPILIQSPSSGTVIFDDTVITITSTDYSGNFTTCSFNITILDTINPTVSCIPSQILYLDTVCNFLLPNYMDSITSSDNCDTNLVITQYPIPNSTIYSDTIVIISVIFKGLIINNIKY